MEASLHEGWEARRCQRSRRHERQLSRRLERELVGEFAIMLTGEFKARYLKRACDRAEVRDDHLEGLHGAIEEGLAHQRIGSRILEQATAGDGGALDARAIEQFAPAPCRLRMRGVDALGVERETVRAQARDGRVA